MAQASAVPSVPVAIAGVVALAAALPVAGPAQSVGFGDDQGADERREQLAQHTGLVVVSRSANT
jgi:hypothetical protein